MSRTPVNIVKVTAGSNQEKAAQSYDDNELSEWTSDGKLASSWIEYELERSASISEVALKMTGWRSSSYPIRITIDGKEVFKNATERNLGYYTAIFPAHTGKILRIELTGTNKNQDAYNIVEITGQKDQAAGNGQNEPKATLGIVEAEVYEKPGATVGMSGRTAH
jgi:hypothetical protein